MKFDALLRRGAGIQLLTPGEAEPGSAAPGDGAMGKLALEPVVSFFRWWLGELKAMLPPKIRRMLSERRLLASAFNGKLCLVDSNSPRGAESCHALGLREAEEGDIAPAATTQRCDLLLDHALVLERDLELPLDAEASLRRVLSFSMDRYTPFSEADVLFDYKVLRRDGANKKIALKLYVAPREGLEPVFRKLASLGVEAATVDVSVSGIPGAEKARAGVNLLSSENRSAAVGMGRGNRVLSVSALVLLLIAVALPFAQRQQSVTQLDSELSLLQAQVRQAEADRTELAERVERMRQIQVRNTEFPSMLDVLLELSHLIPDDAWAGQVAIKSGRVRLTGEAGAASELLALLSNSAIFSDPRFEAPLTQNPRTGSERFVISLAIRGGEDGS